jgi:LysM repeat protein
MTPAPLTLARRCIGAAWRWRLLAVPVALAGVVTAAAGGSNVITVHPGDTLSAIALRYHTTVARLVAINHLPGAGDLIYAGQTLRVPGAGTGTRRVVSYHTVVPGDTLYGIAARYHVKPTVIARRNHLPRSLIVVLGERLAIPHAMRSHHQPSGGGAAGTPTDAARHDRWVLAHHSEPSRDEVAGLIRDTAARWSLDPRLALAVSWQESGFNMREVSPVDAIGAMQVMPYTGQFLAADVVHRPLDLHDASDNVTAGVALLSLLTHEASSTRQAVAGYYQGLQSVRDHGMFASTKQYVASVMALRERF